MNKEIEKLIQEYATERSFTHKSITVEQIKEAEETLSVKLPSQYLTFLKEYGHGGIGGIEILGVGANNQLAFVEETLDYRKYGLPKNLIVIENCGEWLYCIDTETCVIVSWTEDFTKVEYSDFDTYLLDRFSDAAENL